MTLDDCPLDSSYQDVSQWAACLRKAAGPAISNLNNPSDPAYLHAVHTNGPNPWVWLFVGIGALIFCFWLVAYALSTGVTAKPKVQLNPMRPRTGPYASRVTDDGTVWARTKPASMGGQ